MQQNTNSIPTSAISRRQALVSGAAAVIGLPLAGQATAAPAEPCNGPEVPMKLTACHERNNPWVERYLIVMHALRRERARLLHEHGTDCDCVACEVSAGIDWTLRQAEPNVANEMAAWWSFLSPSPLPAEEAAQRLQLPVEMVRQFVEDEDDDLEETGKSISKDTAELFAKVRAAKADRGKK